MAASCVVVEGLVALKIIQHHEDTSSMDACMYNGGLVGVPTEKGLWITDCFAFPRKSTPDYSLQMLIQFGNLNIEKFIVGWYSGMQIESFITYTFLKFMRSYQNNLEASVVLVYDPVSTNHGSLGLRAFRLSESTMNLIANQNFSAESLEKQHVTYANFLCEIPVKIYNSPLTNALLHELHPIYDKMSLSTADSTLTLSTGYPAEKMLSTLSQLLDETNHDLHLHFGNQRRQIKRLQAIEQWANEKMNSSDLHPHDSQDHSDLHENKETKVKSRSKAEDEDSEFGKKFTPIPSPSRLPQLISCFNTKVMSELFECEYSYMMEKLIATENIINCHTEKSQSD